MRQNRIVISKGRNLKEERDDRSHASPELSISNSIRCLKNNTLWFSALPSRPTKEAVYPHGSVGQPCPQALGHDLALEALGGGILVPHPQTKEIPPFETSPASWACGRSGSPAISESALQLSFPFLEGYLLFVLGN